MKPDNAGQRISMVHQITEESQDIVIHMENPELLDHVTRMVLLEHVTRMALLKHVTLMVLLEHVTRMAPLEHVTRMAPLEHVTRMEEHQDQEIPMGLQIREALDLDIQLKKTRSSSKGKSILLCENGEQEISVVSCVPYFKSA